VKIISVINQKGGVGKSTTAFALGAGLMLEGLRVLFIDLDAQSNLSLLMGGNSEHLSTYEMLIKEATAAEATQQTSQGALIAGVPALAAADTILEGRGKEYLLKEALSLIQEEYDYIIIDTPPVLGILTVNALTASAGAIIPAQADLFSVHGITQLHSTIKTVQRYSNPLLRIYGILLTRFQGRTIVTREAARLLDEVAEQLQTKVFETKIREAAALKEAQFMGENIFAYAPRSNAAMDYSAFVKEFMEEAAQ